MCLNSHHLNNLKRLNYIPVGLGNNDFSDEWLRDNTGINISSKNPFYGEYTFYYWIWKNYLDSIENNTWVGFTGYRYHWSQKKLFDLSQRVITFELGKPIITKNYSFEDRDHLTKKIKSDIEKMKVN